MGRRMRRSPVGLPTPFAFCQQPQLPPQDFSQGVEFQDAMRPSRNEDNMQKTGLRPEPLCLFCPPDETCSVARTSYVNALPKEQPRGYEDSKAKQREEFWLRKRTEARIRRRRMKEPIRNLKSFLLTSVKHEQKALPSLFEVLETVKDAWPSPPSRSKAFLRHDEKKPPQPQNAIPKESKMKEDQLSAPQLLNRRFSMPEELMRKYSASKERTSEDSETNKTMVEVSSPSSSSSSSLDQEETARRRQPEVETARVVDPPKRPAHTHNARIIKVKGACTCRRNRGSSTTASAKEETDESGTSESLSSSSPTQLPKRESSSGNLSSESTDHIRCTCAEMTSSKETSTDLFHSGKSTLSQTVSDKSFSTQDSTASINSVSTRGSTVTDNSISTTPEMERTSAKETTTSPDYSPRSPRQNTNRKNRRRDKLTSCPWHTRCPIHPERPPKTTANAATNTEHKTEDSVTQTHKNEVESANKVEDRYKWAKLSQEELYMMQQLRHRKFVESQRRLSSPLPPAQDDIPLSTGKAYQEADALMIPRYSALPRTLSMLVNTSSPDTSLHNSDSDNQSLADSLEDQPVTHMHKLYFDTKKESKPVRGDVNVSQESKPKHKGPRGRAFFVSIKDPYGEDEMLENIEKIPQPPEKIKNQIFERHLNLCAKHQHLHKSKTEGGQKKKRVKTKTEEPKKNANEDKEKPKEGKTNLKKKKEGKDQKGKGFNSKIPVPVSSRSTSSSPEREQEVKEKQQRPKIRVRRDGDKVEGKGKAKEVEATQIMEITQTGTELSLQKPQAVIHPSQVPLTDRPKNQLSIPPLVSTLRMQRQQWNKPFLLSQTRRSPVGKFRQRFEVIPEEKSSSLSSAEEKNGPKQADASTSPLLGENQFQTYSVNEVPNLLMAKITNKQLETLPYVKNNDSQKIILFSSKGQNSNSSKGRDALIAMNREDFNRLAKGWVNFYKLSETVDNSDNEDNTKSNKNKQSQAEKNEPEGKITNDKKEEEGAKDPPKEKEPEPDENLRFHSSNTILSHGMKKQTSLPELKPPNQTKVTKYPEDDDDEGDTDSDSTDYLEPPSPRVPPLPIGGIPSDGTISSSDSELDDEKPQSLKYLQFKRRGANNRAKGKKEPPFETKKKNSGWSVTVAGTVELSRSAPDLEMRLSFPVNGAPPVVSQSDSGFAEDSTNSKLSESLQDLDMYTSRKELPFGSHQKWLLTVKNPKQGSTPDLRELSKNSSHRLPEMESSRNRNASKLLKDAQLEDKLKRVVERKMRAIWPKVQKVIKKEFLTESGRLITELENGLEDDFCLLVRGNAVSLERKEKPPTMTERDVTRRRTSRTDS